MVLGVASAQAQTDQADQAQGGQSQTEPATGVTDTNEGGATGSATGPITEGRIGEAAEETSTAFTPGQGLGVMDDDTLRTRLEAQGYMNLRDIVRSDASVWGVADKDGQVVHVYVIPMDSGGQNFGEGQSGGDGGSTSTQ
jgi:hypothetical protein